jgi:hypothetical protein
MVGPPSTGIPRAPAYSGFRSRVLYISPTGLSPSSVRFPNTIRLYISFLTRSEACGPPRSALTPYMQQPQSYTYKVWATPLSLTTTQGISSISFPPGTEMFHFSGFLRHYSGDWITPDGFPHSDICGSIVACTSPQLLAACHVLLRLLVPRHPPYALLPLTFLFLLPSPLIPLSRSLQVNI